MSANVSAPEWTTVVSEVPLIATVLHVLRSLGSNHPLASLGMAMVGAGSSLGLLRFSGVSAVTDAHELLSTACRSVAFPLIALNLAATYQGSIFTKHGLKDAHGVCALVILFALRYYAYGSSKGTPGDVYDTLLSLASLVAFSYYGKAAGQTGTALILLASALFDVVKATIPPVIYPVDFFHYLLSAGLFYLSYSIKNQTAPGLPYTFEILSKFHGKSK